MIEEPPTPYLQLVFTIISKSGRRVSLTGMTEKEMRGYAYDINQVIHALQQKEEVILFSFCALFMLFFCFFLILICGPGGYTRNRCS